MPFFMRTSFTPKASNPPSSLPWTWTHTGKEGPFDDRVTSREHYVSRPCSSRVVPDTRKVSLQTAPPEERLADTTTYKNYTCRYTVTHLQHFVLF